MATLFPGQCLQPGQGLQSDNKLHTLTMQTDGNVVLYNQQNQPLWATNTFGIAPRDFAMQADGNLVLYDTAGTPRWASQTFSNPGAFLNIQDDGNLVVYRAGSPTETKENALWAAGSNDMPTLVGQGGQQGGQGGQGGSNAQVQEMLSAQNRYRAEVGVAPLQWSDSLAASAQQWADHLAATNGFAHSGSGHGECLGKSGVSDHFPSATEVIDGTWGSEKAAFINGAFPNVSNTGNWDDVGHYTQMVWRGTTQVGCGLAQYDDGAFNTTLVVCQYNPPGNVQGQNAF